jgi:NTE family protein
MAIPGALPPVLHDGDLLCDGGTFNNFPVDVMRGLRGVGQVIGVDLSFRKPRKIDLDEVPGTWALLRDRLRPRASGATACRRWWPT